MRTALRLFLLVGGLLFLGSGAVDGSSFEIALGALATVVGLVGLLGGRVSSRRTEGA